MAAYVTGVETNEPAAYPEVRDEIREHFRHECELPQADGANMILDTILSHLVLMAPTGLTPEEQSSIELWLTGITILVVVLVAGLVTLALVIRHIARRSTRPCQWCMEFIPKKASVCPRCGKNVARVSD